MKLTEEEYEKIHSLVFSDDYSGYRPRVVESPNGDGVWDEEKKYAHIAMKYLEGYEKKYELMPFLARAHSEACAVALWLGLPAELMPDVRYSAMRILDYPPGAVTNPHKDFDLFTLMLYRDDPTKFKYIGIAPDDSIQEKHSQIHYGEILEAAGIGEATMHEVVASDKRQRSIVYFAIPDWKTVLLSGETVGDFLEERLSRSRKEQE